MSGQNQPPEKLEPDTEALEQWRQLPQNKPSPQAFSPATGGMQWAWWVIGMGVGAVILVLFLNGFG